MEELVQDRGRERERTRRNPVITVKETDPEMMFCAWAAVWTCLGGISMGGRGRGEEAKVFESLVAELTYYFPARLACTWVARCVWRMHHNLLTSCTLNL